MDEQKINLSTCATPHTQVQCGREGNTDLQKPFYVGSGKHQKEVLDTLVGHISTTHGKNSESPTKLNNK